MLALFWKNQWKINGIHLNSWVVMGVHVRSWALTGVHFCLVCFSIHPFIEMNIGFKRRSLSDCSTLDWIVFDFFLQYIYIKVGEPQVLGKPWVWKTLCEITLMMGSNNLINQNMSRSGWPFTRSGREKPSSVWWRLDVFKVSFVQNWGYIYKMQGTKLLFLLHAPPLQCNSCALVNLTHHWGESPVLTCFFMTKHPNPKVCQWLGMIILFISEGSETHCLPIIWSP